MNVDEQQQEQHQQQHMGGGSRSGLWRNLSSSGSVAGSCL
jgi:hypothetical protein